MQPFKNFELWHKALQNESFCHLGMLKKPKGIAGAISIAFLAPVNEETLKELHALFIEIRHVKVPYLVEKISSNNQLGTVKIKGIDDKCAAYQFNKLDFFIPEILREKVFLGPTTPIIQGYEVYDAGESLLGPIIDTRTTPQQELLVVMYQSKELLIPYHQSLINNVDHMQKRIIVQLPHGFLEAVCP